MSFLDNLTVVHFIDFIICISGIDGSISNLNVDQEDLDISFNSELLATDEAWAGVSATLLDMPLLEGSPSGPTPSTSAGPATGVFKRPSKCLKMSRNQSEASSRLEVGAKVRDPNDGDVENGGVLMRKGKKLFFGKKTPSPSSSPSLTPSSLDKPEIDCRKPSPKKKNLGI